MFILCVLVVSLYFKNQSNRSDSSESNSVHVDAQSSSTQTDIQDKITVVSEKNPFHRNYLDNNSHMSENSTEIPKIHGDKLFNIFSLNEPQANIVSATSIFTNTQSGATENSICSRLKTISRFPSESMWSAATEAKVDKMSPLEINIPEDNNSFGNYA